MGYYEEIMRGCHFGASGLPSYKIPVRKRISEGLRLEQ